MGAFDSAWKDLPAGGTPGAGDIPITAAYLTAVDTQLRSERSDRVADGLVTKLDQASGSAVIVVFGDSTGAPGGTGDWVIDLAPLLGAKWLTHKVTMRNWGGSSYGSPTTVANASATLTLDIYNGSVGGTKTDYPVSRAAAMLPVRPDLIIINYGHNHTTDTPATLQAGHDTLVSAARAVWADVPVAITSQNPRFSPAGNITEHAARETAKRAWTATREYGYIPGWEAFQAQATPSAWVQSDGIHPTTSGTTDGSALWASVVAAYLASRTKRPQPVASTSSGGGSRDRRWFVPAGVTSIDEFNDDTLDPAWVRVDGTGALAANAAWAESGDTISCALKGGDSVSKLHGLVRPLSGAGGSVAVGDAFITCLTLTQIGSAASYMVLGGLILADGNTFGSGVEMVGMAWLDNTAKIGTVNMTGYNAEGSVISSVVNNPLSALYMRLVCTAANTWRLDISPDGGQWVAQQAARAVTLTPTHVGLGASTWGQANPGVVSFEFLRRVSGVA